MERPLLEAIGLTNSEIDVYLALLELGSCTTGKIVEKSKTASSKIYEVLDKLMDKGLASFVIKSGVKYYEAAAPKRILEYLKEKEEELQQQTNAIAKIIPELELKQTLATHKSEATIYKGIKGGETAFKKILESMTKKDEWIAFTIAFKDRRYFDMITKIHRERAQKGLKARIIFNEEFRQEAETERNFPCTEIKFLFDPQKTPAVVNVVRNTVLLNMMSEDITVILIENMELANAFRAQFETLWNQDMNTTSGFKDVTRQFDQMLSELTSEDEYYVLGASLELGDEKMNAWLNTFHKERVRKKVKVKFLSAYEAYDTLKKNTIDAGDATFQLTKLKKLSPQFSTPFQINLFKNNRVWLTFWGENIKCMEIISPEAYRNFKKYFDALWDQDNVHKL